MKWTLGTALNHSGFLEPKSSYFLSTLLVCTAEEEPTAGISAAGRYLYRTGMNPN